MAKKSKVKQEIGRDWTPLDEPEFGQVEIVFERFPDADDNDDGPYAIRRFSDRDESASFVLTLDDMNANYSIRECVKRDSDLLWVELICVVRQAS